MASFRLTILLLAIACAAVALRIDRQPQRRASCVATCGSVCYWQSDIDDAVQQGCSDLKSGSAPGGYPHQYNDYEGFDFPDAAPWYEFPILSSYKVYTGGSPGADRVVFTKDCSFEGAITHTGASGNNFVQCKMA